MADDAAANQSGVPRLDSPFVQPSLVIAIPWYRFLITLWNRTGGAEGTNGGGTSAALPVGFMAWQAYDGIESGFLLCDGRAVSRTAFLPLFQKLGTKWGPGDGTNTFNLPNLMNSFVYGAASAGTRGGNSIAVLTEANLAPHTHDVVDPGHAHGQQVVADGTVGTAGTQGSASANTTSIGTTSTATTGVTTASTGSGAPFSIIPPYATLVPVIKT